MQNCGIKVEHKNIIKQIKKELIPASYAECGKCGAIKADAKELVRAIENIAKMTMKVIMKKYTQYYIQSLRLILSLSSPSPT